MENTRQVNLMELAIEMTQAGQKIAQNYLNNKSGYDHDNRGILLAFSEFNTKLMASSKEVGKVQHLCQVYLSNQQELWWRIFERQSSISKKYVPLISPSEDDRRFLSPEWDEAPYFFDLMKQSYLLVSKLVNEIIDVSEIDEKAKRKISFYSNHYLDSFSPSNFVATNPEVIKLAQQTNGQSLINGLSNFISDIEKSKITQTDMTAFQVGENIAITPGAVIFENELMQLIQYSPTTKNVYEVPLVVIPPWINKYYILDLQPTNSFVKYNVDKGIMVFIISWKNPMSDSGQISFDDYVNLGSLKAIEVASQISKSKKVNTLGYCLGGTLLSISIAILSSRNTKEENPVNSATFLATMIDFSDVGPMGDVIDGALLKKLERGELLKKGIMAGEDMERAFNLIRANDLVWKYVVNNYLKGKTPSPFDVLYWTNDNTNLPTKMYLYYLRNMIFENKLSRKNALRICDTPIDIGKIEVPVYIVGFEEDSISPPHTTFTTTELVSGPVEFILGKSGHVMGVANPPSRNKYGHYSSGKLGNGFEVWKQTAKFIEGSWWTTWSERLALISGKQIESSEKLGSIKYKIIESSPGRYVRKCIPEFSKK